MFIAALFTITKMWKQPKCPSIDVDKTTMGHVHSGMVLSCKKKKPLPFATVWMDLENIMIGEIIQAEKNTM